MRDAVAGWLGRDDVVLTQISGGSSNLTFRLETGGEDWILRTPPAFVTATSNDMSREWTVLQALETTEVPVPRVIRTCTDPSVLGAPFYVMERLEGVVFSSSDTVAHLSPEQSLVCTQALVDSLATLHAVDPVDVGLEEFGRPAGFVGRQVRRWAKQWELTKFGEVPELDETVRRLADALPPEAPTAIVHGDYSFNNTLFGIDPPTRLLGILDWELSTLGDPLTDVGMLAMYWGPIAEYFWTGSQAHRGNPGFGTTEEMLDRYALSSGRDLSRIDFYVALATLKMAVIMAGARLRVAERDPEKAADLETKSRHLAMLALEATSGLSHRS